MGRIFENGPAIEAISPGPLCHVAQIGGDHGLCCEQNETVFVPNPNGCDRHYF